MLSAHAVVALPALEVKRFEQSMEFRDARPIGTHRMRRVCPTANRHVTYRARDCPLTAEAGLHRGSEMMPPAGSGRIPHSLLEHLQQCETPSCSLPRPAAGRLWLAIR